MAASIRSSSSYPPSDPTHINHFHVSAVTSLTISAPRTFPHRRSVPGDQIALAHRTPFFQADCRDTRATVVDAMSHNFRTIVARDCVGDRSLSAHEANLFDMEQKYADLMDAAAIIALADRAAAA
jgi:hypothetical protein